MFYKYLDLHPGDLFFMQVSSPASILSRGIEIPCNAEGEVQLLVEQVESSSIKLKLRQLRLYGGGPKEIGQFSLRGSSGNGAFKDKELFVNLNAGITCDAFANAQRPNPPKRDNFCPRREPMVGVLGGLLKGAYRGRRSKGLIFKDLSLDLSLKPQVGEGGLIERLSISALLNPWVYLRAPQDNCGDEFGRKITIRLVRIGEDSSDPNPTGSCWAEQLKAAIKIWGKCCVDIEEFLPPARIDDKSLKYESNPAAVVFTKLYVPEKDVIPVFFVASKFLGGGYTDLGGMAEAKVVLMEDCENNPNLLAHELGHVFDGDDSGANPSGSEYSWVGDPCTVMEDTGSVNCPNPELNTFGNCCQAINEVMKRTGYCCMDPDPFTDDCDDFDDC